MSENPADPAQGIGGHAARGMVWAYGSYVGGRLLVLASTAALARLLDPNDFGLVALALTFMALLEAIRDLGLSQALVVQDPSDLEKRASTVFVAGVGLGLLLSAIIVAISPLAESFFHEPDLQGITAVLGCNFFLRSLGATHYALAQKRLDFRTRTIAEFADVLVRGAVGIGLAIAGMGAWALVIGYLTGTFALDVALWVLVRWRPTLSIDFAHLREMTGFGATLSGVDVTNAIMSNVDYLFVGRVLGSVSLGLYTLAYRLPELLIINLATVASTVLYPAFSAVDRDSLGRAFLISLRFTLLISLPIAVGMIVLAKPIVLTLFGSQWGDAAGAMQVLAIFGFAVSTSIPAGTAYKATGRAGVLLWLAFARLTMLITGLAIFTQEGIVAAAACQAVVAGIFEGAGFLVASRLLALPLRRILAQAVPSLVAGAVMAPPLIAINALIDSNLGALLAGTAVGGIAYLGVIALIDRKSLRYLRARIASRAPVVSETDPVAAVHEPDIVA